MSQAYSSPHWIHFTMHRWLFFFFFIGQPFQESLQDSCIEQSTSGSKKPADSQTSTALHWEMTSASCQPPQPLGHTVVTARLPPDQFRRSNLRLPAVEPTVRPQPVALALASRGQLSVFLSNLPGWDPRSTEAGNSRPPGRLGGWTASFSSWEVRHHIHRHMTPQTEGTSATHWPRCSRSARLPPPDLLSSGPTCHDKGSPCLLNVLISTMAAGLSFLRQLLRCTGL